MVGNRPLGVTIISAFSYLGTFVSVLIGILVMFMPNIIGLSGDFFQNLGMVFGVFLIIMGLLQGFVTYNFWNGKNWARIVLLVFVGISTLLSISTLDLSNIFNIIIGLTIFIYLIISEQVKTFFY